ncbi:MAG: thioesterase family protein [Proteobacteria bacterium]|nr:thioesterase family protein [Pseudomonadota bacterium]
MRCWPHDCDINMHMTNSRFASFGDLARIGVLFDQGMMLRLMREKSAPILVAQNTIFFREIPIGRRFTIKSQILGWDDRFWFFQHDFIQGGQVKATTYAKGFFVRHKKVQGFTQILGPHAMPSPELPLAVKHWSESCTELFQASKQREDQAR